MNNIRKYFNISLYLLTDSLIKIRYRLNKVRLKNRNISLISSNCTGGLIYHWLGLKFYSPFINLYMDNKDFIIALENFDNFINTEIKEDFFSDKPYPVGIGYKGTKIHFMHYPNFFIAKKKWDERKKRIDRNNMVIMLCNLGEGIEEYEKIDLINQFNRLTFKNKIIFTEKKINKPNTVYIPGFCENDKTKALFSPISKINGKKYIDQFDYVKYFNKIIRK